MACDIKKGEKITEEHLTALRPAPQGCLIPSQAHLVVGTLASKNYTVGDLISLKDQSNV